MTNTLEHNLLFYLKSNNREFGNKSKKVMSYFTGVVADNPSGSTDNLKTVKYYDGDNLLITDSFKYNLVDNITEVNTIYHG